MAAINEHGKIITRAAKAALAPIGCTQVGRSRTWISDQRYWLIVVEFQPSGWSKGTYLNVGAMWLWSGFRGLAFNVGHRVEGFEDFETADQFTPLVEGMAARAAERVFELRAQFSTIDAIADYLAAQAARPDIWTTYHAAVSTALAGETALSRTYFERFRECRISGVDWRQSLMDRGLALLSALEDPLQFRLNVVSLMEECRALNKLKSDPSCLDAMI